MNYFVGLYLTGEDVATWYQELTQALYERFGGKPLHAHSPPHITVIPPFDKAHLPAVRACLARWKREGNEGPWTMQWYGFGSFEQGVVFGRIEMPHLRERRWSVFVQRCSRCRLCPNRSFLSGIRT